MTHYWQVITNFGASSVLAPFALLAAFCMWRSDQCGLALRWLGLLGLGAFATFATKVAFSGWGVGIKSLDFTGISGHCYLATAIFPVVFAWLVSRGGKWPALSGALLGFALAGLVGYSRVVVEAHSLSEVIAGWLIGITVSVLTLVPLKAKPITFKYTRLLPLALLLAFNQATASYLPTRSLEIVASLYLSGRDRPFERSDLPNM